MTDAQALWDSWTSRIEFDLSSFADPGTLVEVSRSGRSFRAKWTMRGRSREALFSVSHDRGISVSASGRSMRYQEFVAGPDMANLREVAGMIDQLWRSRPRLFVDTRARYEGGADPPAGPAVDMLTTLVQEDPEDATRVVMITGAAGAGKTRVLQELVRRQANRYLRGQTTKLLLYVNAQGRALARLNEALATELQDLKVGLTYHSVTVLTRLGVLTPVIDGFDELLGVSGYDDAFSSLAGFLEKLEGEGQLLASARSVYYEEEFLDRASRVSTIGGQSWSHVPVRVIAWSDDDRKQYLKEWVEAKKLSKSESTRLRKRISSAFRNERESFASKPLFFARMVELLQRNPDFSGSDDLLRSLAHEYLRREQKDKLLDTHAAPLLSKDQFERLFCELAQEMWNQETRELDSRSVREVAEYFVENEDLPDAAKQAIVERMPTLAFLARSEGVSLHAGMSFEHELFFFYFLARSIAMQFMSADADVRVILSRSALPEEVVDRVASELTESGRMRSMEPLQELLDRLAAAGAMEWRRKTQVQENAGFLVLALLRTRVGAPGSRSEIKNCRVRSVVFPGGHLRNVDLTQCFLGDVTVRRTDLTSTRFIDCEARDVMFMEPVVAPASTRLDLRGMEITHVMGLRVRQDNSEETHYNPAFVAKTLKACGVPIRSGRTRPSVPAAHLDLLQRLMRAYSRANPVCKSDPRLEDIFHHSEWRELERLLIEHDIVKEEQRATSGQSKGFLRRRFLPEQIMAGLNGQPGVDMRIRAFWRALTPDSPL